jgi:hypothetical protein
MPTAGDHLPGQQKLSEIAQILMPRSARGAMATRRDERQHHMIAGLHTIDPRPDLLNDARTLMAAHDR